MGNAAYNLARHKKAAYESLISDLYINEKDTFKNKLHAFWDRVGARYKIITDQQERRTHLTSITRRQLQVVGLHRLDMLKPETFYIAKILDTNEKVQAAICGHIEDGASVLLVITNSRIIYLNQIPLFTTIEEIGYGIVQAISIEIGQFSAAVCLYTGVGNFLVHNVNLEAASNFVRVTEKLIAHNQQNVTLGS